MRIVIACALLCLSAATAFADRFCDGFERGYVVGYMRASGSAMEPMTPMCPMQPMKRMSDPDSDYEHGFAIGIERGMREGYRRR